MNDNDDARREDDDVPQPVSFRQQTGPEPSGSTTLGGEDVPPEYHMTHDTPKVALIINNYFPGDRDTGCRIRNGTGEDCRKMKDLLSVLGFSEDDIIVKNDCWRSEMFASFDEVSRKVDRVNAECLVVVILSYGDDGSFYGMDKRIEVETLVNHFKGERCPSLAGKPKLFFLQTCPLDKIGMESQAETGDIVERKIPNEGDILIVHSCIPGKLTWGSDPSQGSLFISTLAEQMTRLWRQCDVQTVMTRMLKQVDNKLRDMKKTDLKLPFVSTTLWRDLYFK